MVSVRVSGDMCGILNHETPDWSSDHGKSSRIRRTRRHVSIHNNIEYFKRFQNVLTHGELLIFKHNTSPGLKNYDFFRVM